MMHIDKQKILDLIVAQLRVDLAMSEQAVSVARDTAVHADCLGSSKYETMGLEASYLAQGQGVRLLAVEKSLAYFQQLSLAATSPRIGLTSLMLLEDESGHQQWLLLAADAGGMKVQYGDMLVTVITLKSPLGKALLGRSAEEEFEIIIAGRVRTYLVVAIY